MLYFTVLKEIIFHTNKRYVAIWPINITEDIKTLQVDNSVIEITIYDWVRWWRRITIKNCSTWSKNSHQVQIDAKTNPIISAQLDW